MNKYTEEYELKLLYISEIASIVFVVVSLLSIFLTHHDIKVLKKEKTLITDDQAYNISYFNRVIIIIILIIFLYITDESRKIAIYKGKDSKTFKYQEIASILTFIASLFVLYSLKIGKRDPLSQVENPIL